MATKKKFVAALIAYAALAALAVTTLSDDAIPVFSFNIRLRTGTLLILGLFAFRTGMYFWRARLEERESGSRAVE